MPKIAGEPVIKTQNKVIVNIKPVKLADVTPAQVARYRDFWIKLISRSKDELKDER